MPGHGAGRDRRTRVMDNSMGRDQVGLDGWRREIAGAAGWSGLAAAWATGVGPLTLVDLFLCLALLVMVPMALALLVGEVSERSPVLLAFEPVAAVAGVFALLVQPGLGAAVLAAPWLLVCATVAVGGVIRWSIDRSFAVVDVARLAARVFLLVGGAWFVISRAGWQPLGLSSDIVELTAVHFHYAGMASSLLASRTLVTLEEAPGHGVRAGTMATAAIVVGPPVVAAGFTFSPVLQVTGAVVLTVGLVTLAWLILVRVLPGLPPGPWRPLLAASACAVVAPMFLAVNWALGQHVDIPSLSIPRMAAIHGSLNALGFSSCGILGWRLLEAGASRRNQAHNARPVVEP
jgi:hypothetical protein